MSEIPMYDFSQITLIIGAGAHVPYGFPSGKGLKQEIIKYNDRYYQNNLENELELFCSKFPNELEDILKFTEYFAKSHFYSVDSFMASSLKNEKGRLLEAGKFLISSIILKYEENIKIGFTNEDWIHFLFNDILKDHLNDFLKFPPAIITFNYDNFLERSFYNHLIYAHNYSHEEALNSINYLNITHVYGSTESLKAEKDIFKIMENIKVIGEERESVFIDHLSKKIGHILNNSLYVYFLGFGFDKLNCNLLFRYLNEEEKFKSYSTNINLSRDECISIGKNLPIKINSKFYKNSGNIDCMQLLKNELSLKIASDNIKKSKEYIPPKNDIRRSSWLEEESRFKW